MSRCKKMVVGIFSLKFMWIIQPHLDSINNNVISVLDRSTQMTVRPFTTNFKSCQYFSTQNIKSCLYFSRKFDLLQENEFWSKIYKVYVKARIFHYKILNNVLPSESSNITAGILRSLLRRTSIRLRSLQPVLDNKVRSLEPVLYEKVKISPIHPKFCTWTSIFILINKEAFKCHGGRSCVKCTIITISRWSATQYFDHYFATPPNFSDCIRNAVDTMKAQHWHEIYLFEHALWFWYNNLNLSVIVGW